MVYSIFVRGLTQLELFYWMYRRFSLIAINDSLTLIPRQDGPIESLRSLHGYAKLAST